jgi:hypothetical protein
MMDRTIVEWIRAKTIGWPATLTNADGRPRKQNGKEI